MVKTLFRVAGYWYLSILVSIPALTMLPEKPGYWYQFWGYQYPRFCPFLSLRGIDTYQYWYQYLHLYLGIWGFLFFLCHPLALCATGHPPKHFQTSCELREEGHLVSWVLVHSRTPPGWLCGFSTSRALAESSFLGFWGPVVACHGATWHSVTWDGFQCAPKRAYSRVLPITNKNNTTRISNI